MFRDWHISFSSLISSPSWIHSLFAVFQESDHSTNVDVPSAARNAALLHFGVDICIVTNISETNVAVVYFHFQLFSFYVQKKTK